MDFLSSKIHFIVHLVDIYACVAKPINIHIKKFKLLIFWAGWSRKEALRPNFIYAFNLVKQIFANKNMSLHC